MPKMACWSHAERTPGWKVRCYIVHGQPTYTTINQSAGCWGSTCMKGNHDQFRHLEWAKEQILLTNACDNAPKDESRLLHIWFIVEEWMVFSVEERINGIFTMGGTTCVHVVLGNLVQGSTSPSPNDFFLEVGDAILLTISMKYMFLMKGDTVYAGVCGLNNHIQTSGNECVGNGALCLHFYL